MEGRRERCPKRCGHISGMWKIFAAVSEVTAMYPVFPQDVYKRQVKGSTVDAKDILLKAGNNIRILSSESKSTTIEDPKVKKE